MVDEEYFVHWDMPVSWTRALLARVLDIVPVSL